MWTKRTLTCACSPLLLWSWYSRKFQFVRENVRHTCKKRERHEKGTHSRTSRWNDLGDGVFEWNIEHSQIQNKKSTLQSLKSHKHPGRGGPYRKPQKSWEKKKNRTPQGNLGALGVRLAYLRENTVGLRGSGLRLAPFLEAQWWKAVINLDVRLVLSEHKLFVSPNELLHYQLWTRSFQALLKTRY